METTNGIELTRTDVIEKMEEIEGSAREKRNRVGEENDMSFLNESIEKAKKREEFMKIQLSRALELSRQYEENVQFPRSFQERRSESRRSKRRKED